MASYSDKTSWWADWLCDPDRMVGVTFPGWSTGLLVADASVPAWEIFAALMRTHGYNFREAAGGTYNCRHINHDPDKGWSLHAYGLAIDLNPSVNPPGDPDKLQTPQHDYPQGFIDDVLATGLFRWGWDWDDDGTPYDHNFIDPMHWEIDVPPSTIGDDMAKIPLEWWAKDAFKWAINNGLYTEKTDLDKVREEYDFQQLVVMLHRYHNKFGGDTGGLNRDQVRAIIDGSQIVAPD